jgi:mannose-6-phosphate isomerase-like protein (cupin superfamily)
MHSGVRRIRRIITGHDATGRSTILSDAPSPHVVTMPGTDDFACTDLWKTYRAPADNSGSEDACKLPITLAPPSTGSVFRIVQFPPDAQYLDKWKREDAFAALGDSGAKAVAGTAERHEGMHRTDSTDYAIVIEGEIFAVLDETETLMRAGDVLVQRGTNHSWSNRSSAPCLVAFVLIDAARVGS